HRYVATALQILTRQQPELVLEARADRLPLVVQPPEPPVEPSGCTLEERAAQARMPLEDAARRHARDGAHQLDRVADGVRDRMEIRMADVAAAGVVLERGVAGRVEPDPHAEGLQRAPQGVGGPGRRMLAGKRVWG